MWELEKYENGGNVENEIDSNGFESWQNGYEGDKDLEAASMEDHIRNNPTDYQAIEFYTSLFNDTQTEIIIDPQVEEMLNYQRQADNSEGQIDLNVKNNSLPIQSYIDEFKSLGINIGSINTGKHNINSKHYIGKAFDIPASKNGGKDGLRKLLTQLKQKYPNLRILDEIDAPIGRVGDGNHIHIEL